MLHLCRGSMLMLTEVFSLIDSIPSSGAVELILCLKCVAHFRVGSCWNITFCAGKKKDNLTINLHTVSVETHYSERTE